MCHQENILFLLTSPMGSPCEHLLFKDSGGGMVYCNTQQKGMGHAGHLVFIVGWAPKGLKCSGLIEARKRECGGGVSREWRKREHSQTLFVRQNRIGSLLEKLKLTLSPFGPPYLGTLQQDQSSLHLYAHCSECSTFLCSGRSYSSTFASCSPSR